MTYITYGNTDNTNSHFEPPSCSCPCNDLPRGYMFQVSWKLMLTLTKCRKAYSDLPYSGTWKVPL